MGRETWGVRRELGPYFYPDLSLYSDIDDIMQNQKTTIAVLILSAIFLIGVFKLLLLRFEAGDVYPAYSSLRSDPLGTRALYESLENLGTVSVSRNFDPLPEADFHQNTTLFYLGVPVHHLMWMREKSVKNLERLAAGGGRLVFSFLPMKERGPPNIRNSRSEENGSDGNESEENESEENGSEENGSEENESDSFPAFPLISRWGLHVSRSETPFSQKEACLNISENGLPQTVTWHTPIYFDELTGPWIDELTGPWKVIYSCDNHPVMIEKPFGRGSLVFSTDAYLFSNEALRTERHPELLTWFVGENASVVFDESHLGIRETLGISGLARKYRLHGLFWGLVVLAGLFVWKNSTYLMPPREERTSAEHAYASERDSTQGLTSLLRRNIPSRDILGICVKEWKTSSAGKEMPKETLEQIETLAETDPVTGYRRICRILSEGRGERGKMPP